MNRLKNTTKRISAYLAILCLIFLNTLTTQAWIIQDMKIFVRNIVLIVFAAIVVIIAGLVLLRKQVSDIAKIFKR